MYRLETFIRSSCQLPRDVPSLSLLVLVCGSAYWKLCGNGCSAGGILFQHQTKGIVSFPERLGQSTQGRETQCRGVVDCLRGGLTWRSGRISLKAPVAAVEPAPMLMPMPMSCHQVGPMAELRLQTARGVPSPATVTLVMYGSP